MKARKYTDDELIWAAYSEAPAEERLAKSLSEMKPFARRTWLLIAKRRLAGGWQPVIVTDAS